MTNFKYKSKSHYVRVKLIIITVICYLCATLQFIFISPASYLPITLWGLKALRIIAGIGFPLTIFTIYTILRKFKLKQMLVKSIFVLALVGIFGYGIYQFLNNIEPKVVEFTLTGIISFAAQQAFLLSFIVKVWVYPAKDDRWRTTITKKITKALKKGTAKISMSMRLLVYSIIGAKEKKEDIKMEKKREEFVEIKTTIELKSAPLIALMFLGFPSLVILTLILIFILKHIHDKTALILYVATIGVGFAIQLYGSMLFPVADVFYPLGVVMGSLMMIYLMFKK